LVTIVALVSPFASDRDQAKSLFPDGDFYEVWVNTPSRVCAERDPKGLYKKAAAGELPNLTGIGQEYEEPADADLILDGTLELEKNVAKLLSELF
jgi:bifunctional enzyme CysN/CysC